MGREIPETKVVVHGVEPLFQGSKHFANDTNACVVEPVAHVLCGGKIVPQYIADNGPALIVEIHVDCIFRSLNEAFHNPFVVAKDSCGVLSAPVRHIGSDVVLRVLPLALVFDAVHTKAAKAYAWLQDTGQYKVICVECKNLFQGEFAERIVRIQGCQGPAHADLVLEPFHLCYEFLIFGIRVKPVQGVFGIGVEALAP